MRVIFDDFTNFTQFRDLWAQTISPKLQFHCGRLLRLHYDCCIVKDVEQKVVTLKTTRETMWSISIWKNRKIINASSQATTPIIVPVHWVVISGQTRRYLQCISVSCMFLVCHYFAKIVEPIKIVFFLSLLYYPFFHPICHHFKRAIWSAVKVITIHFVCDSSLIIRFLSYRCLAFKTKLLHAWSGK